MVVKHQGFCGTWNNYTEADVTKLSTLSDITFLVCGRELAPTTFTPHLQFFFWTGEPRTPQQIKRKLKGAVIFVPGANKGVHYHVIDDGTTGFGYCLKEHQPGWILQGVPPTDHEFLDQAPKGKGTRTDLLAVKAKIDAGTPVDSLMGDDQHFGTFAAHRKFFHEYQSYKRRRTTYSPPEVVVYYGATGTNKTRRVYDTITDLDDFHLWAPHMTQWFDGYNGQKTVLFDEFRGQLPYGQMLSLLQGYAGIKVPVKGTFVHWSPEKIYITSPTHPNEWYPNLAANDKIEQLLRRITTIVHCQ